MAGYIGSKASVVSSGAERKKTFAITTSTTSLTGLSYTVDQVHVFHNGVRLVDGTDYTATNGTSITLTSAAENGDEVVVVSYATFQTSDTVSASAGGTFAAPVTIDGNSATALTVDRATTDGTIIDVQKGGATVGSISTIAGFTVIGSGDTGILFDATEDAIKPRNSSTASRDAAINLGGSGDRFKDLYLSGGVYLGGTGSANLLSDYEQGTWTLTLSNSGGVTNIGAQGYNTYTKIGNTVHIRGYVNFSAASSSSGGVALAGLPFTAAPLGSISGCCFDRYGAGVPIAPYLNGNSTEIDFYQMGRSSGSTWNRIEYNNLGAFSSHFSISYLTNS